MRARTSVFDCGPACSSAESSVTAQAAAGSGLGGATVGCGVTVGCAAKGGCDATAGSLPGPTQRTASATTIPSPRSDSVTPSCLPGAKAKLPSDCHEPPLACWFCVTASVPESELTQ